MNVSGQMDGLLAQQSGTKRLLLHSCCGPCSSYVLEYLSNYFQITLLYYNPCIHPKEEFERRLAEQKRLLEQATFCNGVSLVVPEYKPEEFFEKVKGLEGCAEGGERCKVCFTQRLGYTAQMAQEQGFDYFATTLTVSPHKNATIINQIGDHVAKQWGCVYLPSDFKKKNGYKRSLELSGQYGLYRQQDCGCIFSKREESVE